MGALAAGCATAPYAVRTAPAVLGVDPSIIDRSVDPCADFYQYACGGWLAQAQIPPDRPSWSRGFSELTERNQATLRKILEDLASGTRGDLPSAKKLGDFYGACMDEKQIETRGTAPIIAALTPVDGVHDKASLQAAIAYLLSVGIGVPFELHSGQDDKDATQVIAVFDQDGLTLPDRDYYLSSDPKMENIRRQFGEHIRRMFALLGEAPAAAQRDAQTIQSIETQLAQISMSRVERRDPQKVYHRIELAGLEKLAPDFDWKDLLRVLGHPGTTAINVASPDFFSGFDRMLRQVPYPEWRTYLRWHLLDGVASTLPEAFVNEDFRFSSAALTGTQELPPRWKRCVRAASGALGMALGRAYVQLQFGQEQKKRTKEMVQSIEASLGKDLDTLAWMDAPTRARALQKLDAVDNKIGYPDVWRRYDKLIVGRVSYLANVLAANANDVQYDLEKIGKPVNRQEWEMDPQDVNAYYDPSLNEIVFPAGILQPPFFNPEASEAVNYGGIGMVMGHELTHGFDDEGRQFDAHGNLTDWWTSASARQFKERTACLVKQYDEYQPLPGVHVNGELTLGENIADLGGLKLAYAAMEAAQAHGGVPGANGWSPEQLYFLGQAQAWCEKSRPENERMLVHVDPHSPARFRVNGPMSNLPEFGAAWSCPANAPMVRPPSERCQIW
jgi:endothelin-converting enzyme/putative endopeptidase